MSPEVLARIGLTRLGLPAPMTKLQVVHGLARELASADAAMVTWKAILAHLSRADLESEVLEILCSLVLAKSEPVLSSAELRAAIQRPSVLSDYFISQIFDVPILVNAWAKAHSGEAPTLFRSGDIEKLLRSGEGVPRVLGNRLEKLERHSGWPLLKQWAFEYERLIATRVGKPLDGQWTYFIDEDEERQGATGQFVGKKGQVIRSAYLRVLALAFDQWDMPEETALSTAMFTIPSDLSLLRMIPGQPPDWARRLHDAFPSSLGELEMSIEQAIKDCRREDSRHELLQVNVPLGKSKKYRAEIEMISVLLKGDAADAKEVFRFYDWLPGKVQLKRNADWSIDIESRPAEGELPLTSGAGVLPALVPAVNNYVGYFQSDLVGRMPYLPANYAKDVRLTARAREGGADIRTGDALVGGLRYWNWKWSPTHDRHLSSHVGVAVFLTKTCADLALQAPGFRLVRVWRAKLLTRENEYGEWVENEYYGAMKD